MVFCCINRRWKLEADLLNPIITATQILNYLAPTRQDGIDHEIVVIVIGLDGIKHQHPLALLHAVLSTQRPVLILIHTKRLTHKELRLTSGIIFIEELEGGYLLAGLPEILG